MKSFYLFLAFISSSMLIGQIDKSRYGLQEEFTNEFRVYNKKVESYEPLRLDYGEAFSETLQERYGITFKAEKMNFEEKYAAFTYEINGIKKQLGETKINQGGILPTGNETLKIEYKLSNLIENSESRGGPAVVVDFKIYKNKFDKHNLNAKKLESFLKNDLKFSSYTKTELKPENSYRCNFKKVYFVEGKLKSGKLYRTMIYEKDSQYFSSNDFIKFCAKAIGKISSNEFNPKSTIIANNKDFEKLTIFYREENDYFAVRTVEEVNPEDPNKAIVYFVKYEDQQSYDFPTKKECNLK